MEEQRNTKAGLIWQKGIWNNFSQTYQREIDRRFGPIVEGAIARAGLKSGDEVLDLGTGTGAVALRVAPVVTPGRVLAVDISTRMLAIATQRASEGGLSNIECREGGAEDIPAPDGSFDVVISSLCMMFVTDREAAAREMRRVLKPGGRLVASFWAGPEAADIVRFQQLAGKFAPAPPVPGVGPGALASPEPFLDQLARAGIESQLAEEEFGFDFSGFEDAWRILTAVTASNLSPDQQATARLAVQSAMWPEGDAPRHFHNLVQFIVGKRIN